MIINAFVTVYQMRCFPERTRLIMDTPHLSERSKYILKSLIDLYIADGQPVGSKTIAQLPDLACSPATIRNVMADLEKLGLIVSPHTSAGRVPTSQGFRFFVDSLLTVKPLDVQVTQQLQTEVTDRYDPQQLVQKASNVLSGMTQMAGVVTVPKRNQVTLRQIEFLKLSRQRILAILVLNEAEVQNRILITPREISDADLVRAGNYLTEQFSGKPLSEVRAQLFQHLQGDKQQIDVAMQTVLSMAEQSLDLPKDEADYILAGQHNLLNMIDDQGVASLKNLFDAFSQKRDILQLFDQCIKADGVQIFIGDNAHYQALDQYSLVTAPYQADHETVGIIGVIGPTRMAYDKVVPIVDMTSRLLTMAMQKEG